MFFETWVLWGHAGFFALFASGRLSCSLLGLIFAFAVIVFVPPGWILAPAGIVLGFPGLHFEAFVSLFGELEAPGARQSDKFQNFMKNEATWELSWEPFGTHF